MYLDDFDVASADVIPELKRRIRLAGAGDNLFKQTKLLHDIEKALPNPILRISYTKVMEGLRMFYMDPLARSPYA